MAQSGDKVQRKLQLVRFKVGPNGPAYDHADVSYNVKLEHGVEKSRKVDKVQPLGKLTSEEQQQVSKWEQQVKQFLKGK